MTSSACIVGLLFIGNLAAGCAPLQRAPLKEPLETGTTQDAVALEPVLSPADATREPHPSSSTPAEGAAVKPAVRPAVPSVTRPTDPLAAKVESPAAKTPAKAAAAPVAKVPPAPAEPLQKKEITAPGAVKAEISPQLDLKSLETRLKETKAIGVFTKLTLKNQVDDLLDQFRAFYQGRLKSTLGVLRQSYDSLLLKVLALLQDTDPPLARAIVASRETIWSILADPAKFATL